MQYLFVHGNRFGHITEIKFDRGSRPTIRYLKIEPKQMSLGIGVNPQEQIILIFIHLHNAIQIPTFEL